MLHNRYRSGAPSGETRVVEQESKALVDRGHAVERFERHSDDIEQWSWAKRVMVPGRVIWSNETRRALAQVVRAFRPDVVHIHNTFPLMSPSVLYTCRREHVPAVITIHNYKLLCASGDLFRDGSPCHECVDRRVPVPALNHRCYRGSLAATSPIVIGMVAHRSAWRTMGSAYIFLSEAQRATFSSMRLPPARTFVKANLIPRLASQQDNPERDRLVAYLGRLDAAKGIPLLMEAWDLYRAANAGEGLQLVIAGSGPLESRVAEWAVGRPSVMMVGILSTTECAALVTRARAVILPSQWEETFGLVAIEAMAAGVPPVAAAHGSFPELIRDGTDGVLFEPGNAASLARVLHDVDSDPQRYKAYGEAASRTYEQRFDPDRNIDQLLRIYRFASDYRVFRDDGCSLGADYVAPESTQSN